MSSFHCSFTTYNTCPCKLLILSIECGYYIRYVSSSAILLDNPLVVVSTVQQLASAVHILIINCCTSFHCQLHLCSCLCLLEPVWTSLKTLLTLVEQSMPSPCQWCLQTTLETDCASSSTMTLSKKMYRLRTGRCAHAHFVHLCMDQFAHLQLMSHLIYCQITLLRLTLLPYLFVCRMWALSLWTTLQRLAVLRCTSMTLGGAIGLIHHLILMNVTPFSLHLLMHHLHSLSGMHIHVHDLVCM